VLEDFGADAQILGVIRRNDPQPQDIGAAPTCGLLLDRQAAIEVGLFDERYFIGKEDGDFTHRICLAGYRILELPESLVLHRSRPRGTWLFYYQIRNRWHFMLKNYQWRTLIAIVPVLLVHEPLQLLVLHLQGHGAVYWKSVGGLLALLALTAIACGRPSEEAVPEVAKVPVVPGVETVVVTEAAVRDVVDGFATVVPAGEPAEVRDARAALAEAEARRTLAAQQLRRVEALVPGAVAPRRELEAARAEVAAAEAAARDSEPFTDGVATDWYRRRMVGVFVGRALEQLAPGVREGGR